MKLQPAVKKETAHIALGVAVGVAVMLAVFALLGRFDYTVALGGVLGGAVAVLNFLLLGLTVQKITRETNEERGRKLMQFSYSMRMPGDGPVADPGGQHALPPIGWRRRFRCFSPV